MKLRKIILFLFFVFLFNVVIHANEIDTGFILDVEDVEEQQNYRNASILTSEPKKRSIYSFAVNEEEELIAICQYKFTNTAIVSIYDTNGVFKYAYSFIVNSENYGVEWDGTNLVVYHPRSEVVVSYDINGVVQGVEKIKSCRENALYKDRIAHRLEMETNGCKFVRKNNAKTFYISLTGARSCLVKIENNGTETLIYDSSTYGVMCGLIVFAVYSIIVGIIIFVILDKRKSRNSTLSL